MSRLVAGLLVFIFAATAVVAPVSAETYAGVQPYAADGPIDNGTIVRLADKNNKKVQVATNAQLQDMYGVVVDRNQLSLTVTSENVENETYVAVAGTYNVLVSTQNGPIAKGDYVTLSSVDGVGMKAGTTAEQKTIFGRAQSSFDGKGVALGTMSLKDSNGNLLKTVTIGMVSVTIDIKQNPNEKSTKANVPEVLERIGQAIAEKEVSPIRIYLSIAITAISLITAIVVIYAGIRNSVISIGRNPMSKKSIFRALIQVILTGILIVIIGLFAVYLLLKL